MSGSRGSSVIFVSGYGLDDQVIEVRSPAEANNFSSSLYVQTSSGAHPASCTVGTRGPFTGTKARSLHDTYNSPPIYCRGRQLVGAISALPPSTFMACSGTALAFYCMKQECYCHASTFRSVVINITFTCVLLSLSFVSEFDSATSVELWAEHAWCYCCSSTTAYRARCQCQVHRVSFCCL
jgi:hypothetical protein